MQRVWKEIEKVMVDTQGRMESGAQWKGQGWTPRRGARTGGRWLTSGRPKGSKFTVLGTASVWRKRDGKGMASSGWKAMSAGVA